VTELLGACIELDLRRESRINRAKVQPQNAPSRLKTAPKGRRALRTTIQSQKEESPQTAALQRFVGFFLPA